MAEPDDFDELYERAAPALAAYLRGLVGDGDSAADLAQECFVRLLTAAPKGLGSEQQRAYLYRTGTRLVFDRWRRGEVERKWRLLEPPPEPYSFDDPGRLRDLDRALARLKLRDRALVWLAFVEERSHKEIAEVMAVGEKSVKVLLHRARKRLRAVVEEMGLAR